MRCVLIAALAAGVAYRPATATARPMPHFDLAGLAIHSDAIVIVDRVSASTPKPYSHVTHYRVVSTLRGSLAKGAELDIEDFLYATDGRTLDARAVLFLDRTGQLVPSGLRVLEGGKVFRFEQWNNPGGWTMVPQGRDPDDQWQATPQPVDLAAFLRLLGDAELRVDHLAKARAERDPVKRRAAVLALFAPAGGQRAGGGFYADLLASNAHTMLVEAGDLEGALLVRERDRSSSFHIPGRAIANAQLVAIARDTTRPANVRALALTAIAGDAELPTDEAGRAAIELLDDAAPAVRAAAAGVAARTGVRFSDPKEQARFGKRAREQRAALAKRFAAETDDAVLFAIAEALGDKLPARKGGPDVVAHAGLVAGSLDVRLRCLRARGVSAAKLAATRAGVAAALGAFNIGVTCGAASTGFGGGTAVVLPPGDYAVSVELVADKRALVIPLGTLASDTLGGLAFTAR